MELPCMVCKNYKEEKIDKMRSFVGCNDDKKRKGFKEDTFLYHHTCSNQVIREECLTCRKLRGQYCGSVMSFVDGKCIDRTERD